MKKGAVLISLRPYNFMEKCLIISPHSDDGLLGMGGTIAKLIEEKAEIKYVILSWAGQGFTKEEIKNALKEMGILENNIIILEHPVRDFSFCSSKIREDLIKIREDFKPDIVFAHNSHDLHQDHEVASRESFRVFRERTLFGYVLPWNLREIKFDMFYTFQEKHLQKKLDALKLLNSQQDRFYYSPEKIRAWTISMGLFRRRDFAEAFEVLSQIK